MEYLSQSTPPGGDYLVFARRNSPAWSELIGMGYRDYPPPGTGRADPRDTERGTEYPLYWHGSFGIGYDPAGPAGTGASKPSLTGQRLSGAAGVSPWLVGGGIAAGLALLAVFAMKG